MGRTPTKQHPSVLVVSRATEHLSFPCHGRAVMCSRLKLAAWCKANLKKDFTGSLENAS
uniref:Uncharacterized protein n=1 Tax=Setaria italica TaxID=4555 RepID=K3ZBP5_SETIT